MVDVVERSTPFFTDTGFAVRPVSGVVLHDTETDDYVEPHAAGSWHYEIDRQGTVYRFVAEADVAWHVRATDKWHPLWLPRSSPWEVSPANAHTIGVELVSSQKWRNQGRPYTAAQYRSLQALLLDLRTRYGALPVVGHGHVQADRSDPVWLDWAVVLAVTPEADLALADAQRSDPLQGGYAFAQWTGSVFHPGVDLNSGAGGDADLGKPVHAPVDAVVAAVLPWDGATKGEGNHVWLKADDGHWLHVDHLQAFRCTEGDVLKRGALIGTCGKTGGWDWAHVHWEVLYNRPAAGWWQWPAGWSKARMLAEYMDPFAYLTATWPTGTTGGGGGTVDEPVLSDAELEHEYRPLVWGALYDAGASGFAVPSRWKAEVRLGNDLGKPLGPEEDLRSGGKVQFFERGPIFYKSGKTSLVG
jgi:murein DD-endopeptidase MepM/ murein hydrolase activator NlpD